MDILILEIMHLIDPSLKFKNLDDSGCSEKQFWTEHGNEPFLYNSLADFINAVPMSTILHRHIKYLWLTNTME